MIRSLSPRGGRGAALLPGLVLLLAATPSLAGADGDLPRTAFINGKNARKILQDAGWVYADKEEATLIWLRRHHRMGRYRIDPSRQIYNKLPTNSPMTSKMKLARNVQAYQGAGRNRVPFTFPLASASDLKMLKESSARKLLADRKVWILKESDNSQGHGVTIIPDIEQFLDDSERYRSLKKKLRKGKTHVLQEYIQNPMLLDGRKSEVRMYWAVLSLDPLMVACYHEGQVRLNSMPYSNSDYSNNLRHITNIHQQEKHPEYRTLSDQGKLKWSFQQWREYVTKELGWPESAMQTDVPRQMRIALVTAVNATRNRVYGDDPLKGRGRFELFGCDFIITDKRRVYLTEVQTGPGLSHDDPRKAAVLKPALSGAVDLAYQILNRRRRGQSLADISLKGTGFDWIINEAAPGGPWYFA